MRWYSSIHTSDRSQSTQSASASLAIGDRIFLPDSLTRHSGLAVLHVQGLIRDCCISAAHWTEGTKDPRSDDGKPMRAFGAIMPR